MNIRLKFAVGLLCLAITVGWAAGCGSQSSPAGPTAGNLPLYLTALTVTGNTTLTAPGQTTQLVAEASYSDGSKKDVSSTAQWFSSNRNIVTASGGLVTAVDLGRSNVSASAEGKGANVSITVLPEGTYILAGHVGEAGTLPIADARVEIGGGPMSGRAVMTDQSGQYAFNGVTGVTQVRAAKDGYVTATQNVSQDTEHVNVQLTASAPYASLGGVYRLVFRTSPSCRLPDDAMSRTYTATIQQVTPGATLTVMLSDAQFLVDPYSVTLNRFAGRVTGNLVTFSSWDELDSYLGVVEKLANTRYLSLVGTAASTVTGSTFSAVFAGTAGLATAGDGSGPIATCTAPDHQLIFTPTSAGGPSRARP